MAPSQQEYVEALNQCRGDIHKLISTANCNPILVRLAWHDSGTYDHSIGLKNWPKCGGANASIINDPEISHGANAGLSKAVNYLKPIKEKYPLLSFADIIQMASAEAILLAGGPKIPMIYGRLDSEYCPPDGNLPSAGAPFPEGPKTTAEDHLRNVFHRMGMTDQEIVCLSGAHTLGRAFKERSGVTGCGYGGSKGTKFTNGDYLARRDMGEGVGMAGGKSWTKRWLSFDNSYFTEKRQKAAETDDSLLWLETDKAVKDGDGFKHWFELYAEDEGKFFEDYQKAHKKLSELGSKFFVDGGIKLTESSKL